MAICLPKFPRYIKVNRWAAPLTQMHGTAKSKIFAFDINWAFDDLMQLVGSGCFHGHAEYKIIFMRVHALQL
jgi:hypothetical protein